MPLQLKQPGVTEVDRGPRAAASSGVTAAGDGFESILFPGAPPGDLDSEVAEPAHFRDLNLDQIVDGVCRSWSEYGLASFFRRPLQDEDAIRYRQEVARELEHAGPLAAVTAFTGSMRRTREALEASRKRHHVRERQAWFLAAVATWCDAVRRLRAELDALSVSSRGLQALRAHVERHAASAGFSELAGGVVDLRARLARLRFGLRVRGASVTVRPLSGEPDLGAAVERTFERFRRGAAKDHHGKFATSAELNHVEGSILDRLALIEAELFGAIDGFCARHAGFVEPRLARFGREVQFYVAYLKYVEPLRSAGLSLCYPAVSAISKEEDARAVYDLALATALNREGGAVVPNDYELRGRERTLVVTGPNQGGKTTFARTFGQLHHLASLGLPVPGRTARLFLCDAIYTHFEREERLTQDTGKLRDDLLRIHHILDRATPRSVIILNEIFSSTTLRDARFLGREILGRVSRLDALCVWITFLQELAAFDDKTASLVGVVDPADPTVRTFRLERRPAGGPSYALALAERYGVTYDQLLKRFTP